MNFEQDYQAIVKELEQIPFEKLSGPKIPVDIYVHEAETLYVRALKDKEILLSKGLRENYITDLLGRAGALRYAQAEWMAVFNNKSEEVKKWKDLSLKAIELRREILHDFQFAYRKDEDLKKTVDRIAGGNGYADLIQDFMEIITLAKANPKQLQTIGVDGKRLSLAAEYANTLGIALAYANSTKGDNSRVVKEMRDRAYIHLKEGVDEICEYGKYAFWKDEKKMKQYTNSYFRNLRKKKLIQKIEIA